MSCGLPLAGNGVRQLRKTDRKEEEESGIDKQRKVLFQLKETFFFFFQYMKCFLGKEICFSEYLCVHYPK